eukprot:SAG31_NODE_7805_length_1593_cov_1.163989_2_plen_164_part_00
MRSCKRWTSLLPTTYAEMQWFSERASAHSAAVLKLQQDVVAKVFDVNDGSGGTSATAARLQDTVARTVRMRRGHGSSTGLQQRRRWAVQDPHRARPRRLEGAKGRSIETGEGLSQVRKIDTHFSRIYFELFEKITRWRERASAQSRCAAPYPDTRDIHTKFSY